MPDDSTRLAARLSGRTLDSAARSWAARSGREGDRAGALVERVRQANRVGSGTTVTRVAAARLIVASHLVQACVVHLLGVDDTAQPGAQGRRDIGGKRLVEAQLRDLLLSGVELRPGQRVLDIGCGTGTLICELKRREPGLDITGIDPDAKALALARKKAEHSVEARGPGRGQTSGIELVEAFSDALPAAAHSFDHVFSSFMFHHLEAAEKRATLVEVLRVLKPGGYFHLLDFRDEPQHKSFALRLLHAFSLETKITGQRESEVEALIRAAGFVNIALEVRRLFVLGAVAKCRAQTAGSLDPHGAPLPAGSG